MTSRSHLPTWKLKLLKLKKLMTKRDLELTEEIIRHETEVSFLQDTLLCLKMLKFQLAFAAKVNRALSPKPTRNFLRPSKPPLKAPGKPPRKAKEALSTPRFIPLNKPFSCKKPRKSSAASTPNARRLTFSEVKTRNPKTKPQKFRKLKFSATELLETMNLSHQSAPSTTKAKESDLKKLIESRLRRIFGGQKGKGGLIKDLKEDKENVLGAYKKRLLRRRKTGFVGVGGRGGLNNTSQGGLKGIRAILSQRKSMANIINQK